MLPNTKFRKNGIANEVFTPSEPRFGVTSPELRSRPQEAMSDLSEDYACSRVKLLCRYGGHILPRPGDDRLRYVGGETRIITVSRDISFSELMVKILEIHGQTVSLKYQLPDEDLDALVSVCSNEDLEIMMDEYDTIPRIRVYLFSGDCDVEHFSDSSGELRNSEQLYLDAINGILDSPSVKNSGSGVSDVTQDLENLIGIELGDRWSASSMEDTLPPPMKAQPFQSSLPMEQPLPVPSQLSLLHKLPSDLFSMLSLSTPFSSTTSFKDAAIPSTSAIPVISPKITFETSNAKIYPSSSSSEATSPIMKAQPFQNSLPMEQSFPAPSQLSLLDALSSDLFSTLSLSPPFSSTTSFKDTAIPSTSAIPVIAPKIPFETGNAKTSSSSESTSPIMNSTCSFNVQIAAELDVPAEVMSEPTFTQPIPIIQNEPVNIFPSPGSIITASEEPHVDPDPLQQFPKLLISQDDIQNAVLDQTQENSTIASVSRVSSMYGSDRQHSLLERNPQQASQLAVNIDDLINRDAIMIEEVLEAWSASVAVGDSTLPSASSTLSGQVSTAPLPDLLNFSPAIETIELKMSNGSDPTSEPQWTLSKGTTYKETATCLKIEPSKWLQEPSLRDNSLFLEQLVTRENTPDPLYQPVDSLVGSPLPNFLDMDPLAGDTASYLRPQRLWQQESMYLFLGQQPKLELSEEHRGPQEQVVFAAKQDVGSGEMIAQQENLIVLDMQHHKHDLDVLSVQSTPTLQNTRMEQPNYLDAEFHQTTAAPQVFSDVDITSQSASSIGLDFDVITEQNLKSTFPDDLYIHPLVPLPEPNITESQNPPESVDLLGDPKFTSSTTVSNAISLLESFEGLNVQVVDASKSSEKPTGSGHRISVGVQVDEVSQLSAELDKLEDLLVGQGCRLANVKTNEIAEKTPGHPLILPEPSTDTFFDLLTSPANIPPQLLTPSVTINATTTTSILSKSNFLETQPVLVPDPIDVNLLLVPNISLDEAVSKADSSSVAIDSNEQLKQTGKITTTVELQESFSFSAGPRIESGKPENPIVQNPNMGKNINEVDPRELEVVAETNLELEYESVHASLTEEAISTNSSVTASAAELEAIARGLQIIRYADLEERRELGSGTYGTVYHGKWRGSDVAIKRIKASCFTGSPSEQERLKDDFWREACILAQLHHPNVVAFYGVVPDGPGGTLATVTEYMVNGSLKQFLRKNDRLLDRRRRFIIAMDATFGMEYLHGKNIVHFDLKCDNLLVNMRDPHRPICKVGDLGLSKVKQQTLVSGGVRGTLPWMAPELLNGNSSKVCVKVDVFSFGIVMWELLTGEEPYAELHYGAIIGGIVSNSLRPTIPKWCDSAWRSLMERCWAADPPQRPSFTEIASELRAMGTSQLSRVRVQNQV